MGSTYVRFQRNGSLVINILYICFFNFLQLKVEFREKKMVNIEQTKH